MEKPSWKKQWGAYINRFSYYLKTHFWINKMQSNGFQKCLLDVQSKKIRLPNDHSTLQKKSLCFEWSLNASKNNACATGDCPTQKKTFLF